ncbi:Serine protease family S54 [Phytophthora palmivora]|uniref:Serine protease family S54 n=1 Tax=Phytophthora palmivora TaxID=4796 RepID=A0A2P4XZM9_9STRA|nr:Serine protease family S54 [Phytophthora palmivora]
MRLFRRKKTSEKKNEDEKLETDTGIPPPLLMVFKSVQQMDRKPPVTLTLIGVMYFLHVQATRTPSLVLPFVLCPGKVVANKEIGALFIAPFIHLDDLYLYQSILSFLWKGYKLESRLGSIGFCVLLVSLIVLSQGLIVYGAHLISRGAVQECFTGFSGVLTAMKVILNVNSPTFTKLYSFKVPTKYAAWLELFVTYLLVPKLPLLAQAAGLIAGYIYVVTPNADALVGCASQHIRQLLIRIGLVRRPFQWWQIWPKFVDSMSRRRNRRESHRD